MNHYLGDELANKVYHLHQALNQANKIISLLEEENQLLKLVLDNLNKSDKPNPSEWANSTSFAA